MNIKNKITNSLNNIKQWLVREQELVSASVPLRVPPELNIFSRDILKLQIDMIMSEDRDFHWLQTDYILNSYGDMVFMYKNNIFSILIDIQDETGLSYLDMSTVGRQLRASKKYNFIPCRFPVVAKDPYNSDISQLRAKNNGLNLINTLTNEEIIQSDIVKKQATMSDWELQAFAVRYMLKLLQTKNCQISSYSDIPEINPSIWFEDNNGNNCWLIIRCAKYSDNKIKKQNLKSFIKKGYRFNGYFATFVVTPETSKKKINRGDNVNIRLTMFKQVHTITDSIDITCTEITDDNIYNLIMSAVSFKALKQSSKVSIFDIPGHDDMLLKIGNNVLDKISELPKDMSILPINNTYIDNPNFGNPLYYVQNNKNIKEVLTHEGRDKEIVIIKKVSGECIDNTYLDIFNKFSGYRFQSVRYKQFLTFIDIIKRYGKDAGKKALSLCAEGVSSVDAGMFSENSEPYRFMDIENFYEEYKLYMEKFLEYMKVVSGLPQKTYTQAVKNILSRTDFIFDFSHSGNIFVDYDKKEFNFIDFVFDKDIVEIYKNNNQIQEFRDVLLGENKSIDFSPEQIILYPEDIEVFNSCSKIINKKINRVLPSDLKLNK